MTNWKLEALRLTVFPRIPPKPEDVATWWESTIGSKPEIDRVNNVTGERTQEGNYLNGRLILEARADRIDWNLVPFLNTFPPTLGEIEETHNSFRDAFYNWLEGGNISIRRFALGSINNRSCSDHAEAYNFLDSKLPFVQLDPNSFDFNYQINRPRFIQTSFNSEFKINRLSKWIAIKGIFEKQTPEQAAAVEHKFYAARCEFDINTDADFLDEIPTADAKAIFGNCFEFSQEILIAGDCK